MKANAITQTENVVQLLMRTFGPIETARIIRVIGAGDIRDYTAERHTFLSKLDPRKVEKSIRQRAMKKKKPVAPRRKRSAS